MAEKVISAQEYKSATRKIVTAPSGAKFLIKRVNGRDFVSSPYLPVGFDIERFREIAQNNENDIKQSPELIKESFSLATVILLAGVLQPKLVDKPPAECSDDELSVHDLLDEDVEFLVREITSFSNLDKGASERIAPFLEQPEPTIVRPPSKEVS